MKRIALIVLSMVMILTGLTACATPNSNTTPSREASQAAYDLLSGSLNQPISLHIDYWRDKEIADLITAIDGVSDQPQVDLGAMDSATYTFTSEDAVRVHFSALLKIAQGTLLNPILKIEVNGEVPFREALTVDIPIQWRDVSKDFALDSYGDESLPNQVADLDYRNVPLYNNIYSTVEPLSFALNAGVNTVKITNISSDPVSLRGLRAIQPWSYPTYASVKPAINPAGEFEERIDAIDYAGKNSSFVRMSSYASASVAPFDPVDKRLNIIAGVSWKKSGQALEYEIDVPADGYYHLSVHYMNEKSDFAVFRSVAIDGEIPFREVAAYAFPMTGTGKWAIETLRDENGEPYYFKLEKGKHTLTLRAESAPLQESLGSLQLLIDHINQFALDIRKITGKDIDRNRTWKLTNFLPETAGYLEAYEILIETILAETSVYAPNGMGSSTLSYLQKALYKIRQMRENPDELPLYLDDLYSQTGSVTEMIGNSLTGLADQSMSLDEIAIGNKKTTMVAEAGFIESVQAGVISFVSSFTSKKYVAKNDPKVLNVWVNRSITYVDTMQKLVDADFTAKNGIKVKISVMPDVNKLILANAANQSPDIALGLPSYMPFDFAIRGAAYKLSDFDDYWEVAGRMTPGSLIPYIYQDDAYALPETLDFHTLIYRTDIFDGLDLSVPDTWRDVLDLLPELQRYGMNFYYLTAGGGSLKWFYQTSPFIYQYGGSLYDDTGLRSGIDSPEAVAGVKFLSELFTTYSIPEQVPSFYNSFRYGTLPIGIADFATYLQIKNAAPELAGQWALAPYPGTVNEEGEVVRWDIVNGTSGMVFSNTDKPNESWTFLKWWMETETQTSFAYNLQSTYGPEYVWLSANLEAVANSPIEFDDKSVILEQVRWLNDVPRTPGQYMLERGMSDIWNTTVFDGTPVRVAIDRQKQTIDREIRRKMIEFGFLDKDGNVLKEYIVHDVAWIIEQIEAAKGE